MPPFMQFLIRRLLLIPISLFIITLVLYGGVVMTPPEARVQIYRRPSNAHLSQAQEKILNENLIRQYHLRDPFPVQYFYWVKSLFDGTWGYSPSLRSDVLPALLQRTPSTAELTLYSLILFVPFGLLAGVFSGWKPGRMFDTGFRGLAFISTSIPPFILALVLMTVFYVNLGWFTPERLDYQYLSVIQGESFHSLTGLITIDAFLNGRYDVLENALRHLAMPAVTLSLFHWATLGRLTRSIVSEQRHKEYIVSARARGLAERRILWVHAFRNALAPALISMGLSAATLMTGVFVVEIIFSLNGISEVITHAMSGIPDAPAALGFAVYSVILVLLLMFVLDVIQAIIDPRVRKEMLQQ